MSIDLRETFAVPDQTTPRPRTTIASEAGLIRKMRDKMREQPPLLVLLRVVDRVLPHAIFGFNRLIFVAAMLPETPADPESFADIRWAVEDDNEAMEALGFSREELAARRRRGARAAILERNGRVLGHEWWQVDNYSEDPWLSLKLEPTDVWYYGLFVDPSMRRQGVGTRIKDFMDAESIAAGCRRALGVVIVTNIIAMRAQQHRGFAPVGHVTFVRILGLALVRVGNMTKIGFWTGARPLVVPFSALDPRK